MYAPPRSMNNALSEGATDGKYKKIIQNRDNAEDTTFENRADLNDNWYGVHEKKVKVTPDGLLHATPNFVPNAPVQFTDVV